MLQDREGYNGTKNMTADILPLRDNGVFDPEIAADMAAAVDEVSKALGVNGDKRARETIAVRAVELARRGDRDPKTLRDHLLQEVATARGWQAAS
jgi:hypothetical protein